MQQQFLHAHPCSPTPQHTQSSTHSKLLHAHPYSPTPQHLNTHRAAHTAYSGGNRSAIRVTINNKAAQPQTVPKHIFKIPSDTQW
mmetsp:Transcript_58/g.116  ORF Transcript_58/g.116 Transcript_58/m.116 type:complete len:85 (-) Transcript_58:1720-1974(-)